MNKKKENNQKAFNEKNSHTFSHAYKEKIENNTQKHTHTSRCREVIKEKKTQPTINRTKKMSLAFSVRSFFSHFNFAKHVIK